MSYQTSLFVASRRRLESWKLLHAKGEGSVDHVVRTKKSHTEGWCVRPFLLRLGLGIITRNGFTQEMPQHVNDAQQLAEFSFVIVQHGKVTRWTGGDSRTMYESCSSATAIEGVFDQKK